MEFKLKITMADPAGNRTAFAEGPVEPKYYAAVGAALLKEKDLHAEQAGFVCPPKKGSAGRLEMMGGEFCGNAARSFGLWLGTRSGKKPGETVPVEISGSTDVLDVLLEEGGSWISMPLPLRIDEIAVPKADGYESKTSPADGSGLLRYPAVVLEGITHVVLENVKPSETLAHAVIKKASGAGDTDAVGAIFVTDGQMTPAVWVRATDSFVWESSCGSGTLAAAAWLSRHIEDGTFRCELKQPGGILKAEIQKSGGVPTGARIGGPVFFEDPINKIISV